MGSFMTFMRARFHFTLWPTVFTIPAIFLMLALGTWQVQRLAWKTALIDERTAALAAPAVPAPMTAQEVPPLDFHPVFATGVFDHLKELYIGAFDKRGVEGFQIVTPMTLADGHVLLVNRGFVPGVRKDPATREAGEIQGETRIDGILRLANPPIGWLIPQNRPGDNFWFFVDLPAMTATVHLDNVLPYYVEAGPAPNPGGFPIGGQTRIALPNDHLQYALTWYCFAVTLAVIYFVYHRKKPSGEPPAP
jgi:surfeit locus 1 family protein